MLPGPLPSALLARARWQAGLLSVRQCEDAGVPRWRVSALVRHELLARVTTGVVDATRELARARIAPRGCAPEDEERQRVAWTAVLAYGPEAIAVGMCALVLLGVQGLPKDIRGQVALPAGDHRRPRAGVAARHLPGVPFVLVDGVRVATPVHALAQALPELGRRHGLAVLDSALNLGLITPADLVTIRSLLRGRRGAVAVVPVLELADGRAQSPLESWARLDCIDAGIPPDDLQVPIRDGTGRIVARGDLGWRLPDGRWLIAEIDGASVHAAPDALFGDRRRQNAVVGTRTVDMLRFTARDLGAGGTFVRTLLDHLPTGR